MLRCTEACDCNFICSRHIFLQVTERSQDNDVAMFEPLADSLRSLQQRLGNGGVGSVDIKKLKQKKKRSRKLGVDAAKINDSTPIMRLA